MNQQVFLEIKHLKMVRTIAGAGTMTRAARSLFLSQSALSQQLKDIETKLGTRFFYRTRKKMVLTPAGQRIMETAAQVVPALEEAEADIARMVSGETGELKVGTQCIFCYRWLPGVMAAFQDKFPNVELEIGNSADAARELADEEYHLVVTVVPEKMDDITVVPLFRDEMTAVLPAGHPLSGKPYLTWRDFEDENLISVRPKAGNWFFQNMLKPRGISPRRFMTVAVPNAMTEMVAAGFGIAMAPVWAVRSQVEAGRIITRSVGRSGLFLTWQAMFLKTDPSPVFFREFIRLVGRAGIPDAVPQQNTTTTPP